MSWPDALSAATSAPALTIPSSVLPGQPSPSVVARTISVTDPKLGPLTFDALASGDPALAKQGRLVLLLHGFPESDEAFRQILPKLAAAGYYAVAPNQRGYSPGARPGNVSDYNLTNMVYDTEAMANALGATRFHLVGHDWGAAVAWITAAELPQAVSSLMTLSIPHPEAMREAYNDPNGVQKSMFAYIGLLSTPGIQYILDALGPGFFAQALHFMGAPLPYAELYAEGVKNPTVLGLALDWYRANPVPSATVLPDVVVPTVFMWGTKDFAISREAAEDTAHYVTGPYKFIPLDGIDHFVPENATAAVTTALLTQLATTH